MDSSLKSSVSSSVAAHTGYSWKGSPPDLRGPTVSIDPHGRNHQVHSDYIRPIASPRERRTDHWVQRQGKTPDGFADPPAASGPNWRQSQPFGIAARHGLTKLKPSYEDLWNNIELENDSRFSSPGPREPQLVWPERGGLGAFRQGQDVPPSTDIRSLHGIYDNSWYSPSPPPYCEHAESDAASYLSIRPETDTSQNQDVSNYPRGTRSFEPLPPVPEGSGRKVDEVTRTSNTTGSAAALKTSWISSDPQPTGKRSPRKRCIWIIVGVVLAAVIASVVSALVFHFLLKDDGLVQTKPPVKLAFLKEPAVMKFKMAEPASVDQLEILRGEDHLFTLNVTGNTTVSPPGQRMRVDIRISTDFLTVTLTLMNATCIDEGSYVVIARGKEREERKTVVVKVSSPPTEPILKVPDAVEGVTAIYPTCSVTSFGYNPVMTLTWVLKRPDGRNETKATYDSNSPKVTIHEDTCNSSIAQTTLDANRYTGWNNSQLCCQVTDPHTSTVVKEKCQLMLLVPGDYCSGSEENLPHPYDPCNKWVQCVGKTEFVNSCIGTGFCYNISSNRCDIRP